VNLAGIDGEVYMVVGQDEGKPLYDPPHLDDG
jgi:hypothetical protein